MSVLVTNSTKFPYTLCFQSTEKDLVIDMITSAISSEETYWNQQQDPQDYYENREKQTTAQRPRTNNRDYIPSTADAAANSRTNPEMMNVHNGYGELDKPLPPSRGQQANGYSRYNYSRDGGERRTPRTAGGTQLDTIYDDQGKA